jgi:hypothetical protein
VFSPPNTPVRMQGDVVGRGFAIEIEDRGLGISQARLDEINSNLANPPQFDLSGSDRLGLFIASQLARRHDIKVNLRPSVYGGTTAIVLLPTALVVAEHSFDRDPALPPGRSDQPPFERMGGRHAALSAIPAGNGSGAEAGNGHAPSPAGTGRSPSPAGFTFGRTLPAPGTGPDGPTVQFDDGQRDPSQFEPLGQAPVGAGTLHGAGAKPSSASELAELGLPVRVRQASIAPQLKDTPPAALAETPVSGGFSLPTRGPSGSFTPPPAESASLDSGGEIASPEAARATMSALQRGWQLGRAEPEPESAEPSAQASEADSNDED